MNLPHIYLIKNQNTVGLSTCEQSRVQVIDQKANFVSNNYQPNVKAVKLKVTNAKFENIEQLLPDLNICVEGESIIDERGDQLKTSK